MVLLYFRGRPAWPFLLLALALCSRAALGQEIAKVAVDKTPRFTLRFVQQNGLMELKDAARQEGDELESVTADKAVEALKKFVADNEGGFVALLPDVSVTYVPRLSYTPKVGTPTELSPKALADSDGKLTVVAGPPPTYEIDLGKLKDAGLVLKMGVVEDGAFAAKNISVAGSEVAALLMRGKPDPPTVVAEKPAEPAEAAEIITFLKGRTDLFPGFVGNQLYERGDTVFLFLNRELHVAPGTAWPDCNRPKAIYKVMVVDKPGEVSAAKYQLLTEVAIIREPELRIYTGGGAVENKAGEETDVVQVLGYDVITPRVGSLQITTTLNTVETDGSQPKLLVRRAFRLDDCDLAYHVGIMLGVNASFLSTPTNIATSLLPNSTTDYTLVADDPTTHQSLTVMAIFYPTPRRYGYAYKDLSFFQKFNVSVGSQVGPSLLSDVLLGLNYELSRGLNFGAGGHYGRHRTIIGQPDFRFGKDVYAGGSTFTEATNTRMQWDLAWYVGLGIDLRVIGVLGGRERELRALRTTAPLAPTAGTAAAGR